MTMEKRFRILATLIVLAVCFIDIFIMRSPMNAIIVFLLAVLDKKSSGNFFEIFRTLDEQLSTGCKGKYHTQLFIIELICVIILIIGLTIPGLAMMINERKKHDDSNSSDYDYELSDPDIPTQPPNDGLHSRHLTQYEISMLKEARRYYFLYCESECELEYLNQAMAHLMPLTINQSLIDIADISQLSAIQLVYYEYAKRYKHTLDYDQLYDLCIQAYNASSKLLELDASANKISHTNYCLISMDLICQAYNAHGNSFAKLDYSHILENIYDHTNVYVDSIQDNKLKFDILSRSYESVIALALSNDNPNDATKAYQYLYTLFLQIDDLSEEHGLRPRVRHIEHFIFAVNHLMVNNAIHHQKDIDAILGVLDRNEVLLMEYEDIVHAIRTVLESY